MYVCKKYHLNKLGLDIGVTSAYLGPGDVISSDAPRERKCQLRQRGVRAQHGGRRPRRLPRHVSERVGPLALERSAQRSKCCQHTSVQVALSLFSAFCLYHTL